MAFKEMSVSFLLNPAVKKKKKAGEMYFGNRLRGIL